MATGTRALTLKLLADVDNFNKNLKAADTEVTTFGGKVSEFGKKAGLAFAAAGVAAALYAGKLLKDGVEAAIADEKANALLANTLRNVAGATDETIEKTLAYTRATELATGVTEDELRPSLNRLTIATGDVQKAIDLQSLALDVSAGSGKSLEAVTQALAKAQEGNTASLGRLGVGLTSAQLQTMSMDEVTKSLSETFAGAADTAANTFEGKMTRLGLAFEDVRDTVGGFVLDAIIPFVEKIFNDVIPALDDIATTIGDDVGPVFKAFFETVKDVATPIFESLKKVFNTIKDSLTENKDEFSAFFVLIKDIATFVKKFLVPVFGETLKAAFTVLAAGIKPLITAFASVAGFIGDAYNGLKNFISLVKNNPLVKGISGAISNIFGGGKAAGGPVTKGTTYLVGEKGPELFTPKSSGSIIPNNRLSMGGGGTINITVNGAIDSESTARQIVKILNDSQSRGTLGAGAIFP
jgi:phage-related protein